MKGYMDIEKSIEESKELIKNEMSEHFTRTDIDGKLLRGSLTVLVAKSLNGVIDKAIKSGAAVEFIHQGSLVHDNILDEHVERRGKPTEVITMGIKKALFIGDLMFTNAIKIGAESGSDEAKAVATAMGNVLKGAIEEMSIDDAIKKVLNGEVESDLYYRIIDLKTAALFSCAAQFGGMSVENYSPELISKLTKYGILVGEAYQIADDYVDMNKMASGDLDVTPLTVLPIIPAFLRYNGSELKRVPLQMFMGKFKPMGSAIKSLMSLDFSAISGGISEAEELFAIAEKFDISQKMLDDMKSKVNEAQKIISSIDSTGDLSKFASYAVDAQLKEINERLE